MRCALALLLVLSGSSPASAEPLVSSFDDVLASSTDVVIATSLGGQRLRVERALRGSLRGEIDTGLGDGHADVETGRRVVAFLDASRAFRFVGEAPSGRALEDAALTVRGFYDFNAHLVTDGLLTLAQLEARLIGRRIAHRFEGPLVVLSPDGARLVESALRIAVRRTADGAVRVSGLPPHPGLPAPSLRLGGWGEEDALLTWRSSWPRPLQIAITVVRVEGDVMRSRFHVRMPEYLFREADIRAYLADADAAYVLWPIEVRFASGERWTGDIGSDYSSGPRFVRPDGQELAWSTWNVREDRSITFRDRRWALAPARPGPFVDRHGDARTLVQELHRGPLGLTVGAGPGYGQRGEIRLGSPRMMPAIRAR